MGFKYDQNYKLAVGQENWFRRVTMKKRLSNIDKAIKSWKHKRVLDIGCSGGMLQKLLSSQCREVYGLDINLDQLNETGIEGNYVCGDAMQLPFKENDFDVVICSHLLEHLPSVQKSIQEINRILRPKGNFFVLYPIELFRGATCIPDVLLHGQKISRIRKIHLHRLSLKKLKRWLSDTELRLMRHKLIFALQPMYLAVMMKIK